MSGLDNTDEPYDGDDLYEYWERSSECKKCGKVYVNQSIINNGGHCPNCNSNMWRPV